MGSWRRWDNGAGVYCKCCLESRWQFQVTPKRDEPFGETWSELRGMFVRTCTELLLFGMCLCVWTRAFLHVGVTLWVRFVCLCIGLYVCLPVHARACTCWWCPLRTTQYLWQLIKRRMLGWSSVCSPSDVRDLGSAHSPFSPCLSFTVSSSSLINLYSQISCFPGEYTVGRKNIVWAQSKKKNCTYHKIKIICRSVACVFLFLISFCFHVAGRC